MRKEAILDYFQAWSWHSLGWNNETHDSLCQ